MPLLLELQMIGLTMDNHHGSVLRLTKTSRYQYPEIRAHGATTCHNYPKHLQSIYQRHKYVELQQAINTCRNRKKRCSICLRGHTLLLSRRQYKVEINY